MVADQPMLKRKTVAQELEFFRAHSENIVGLGHNGVRGNPCIFPARFFPELDGALGQRDGVAAKPAPDMVQAVLSRLGAEPGRALYVGDSEVDVGTARNAGLAMIGVSWGFRGRAALESAGAPAVADTPAQLLELLR